MYCDHAGKAFGRLKALKVVGYAGKRRATLWQCRCSCGNIIVTKASHLVGGQTQSCGCLQKEKAALTGKSKSLPNSEAAVRNLLLSYRRRAKQKGIAWSLSREQADVLLGGKCLYCGDAPLQVWKGRTEDKNFVYNGIDRLDSSKGYIVGNVVSCCGRCNYAKQSMSYDEFVTWIKKVSNHLEEKQCRR